MSAEEIVENGADDGGGRRKRLVSGMGGVSQSCTTLFIDGIAESVGYYQVKDLFAKHGKLASIFVQRLKNQGRVSRFGFARFVSKEHASTTIKFLHGVKLGGFVVCFFS